MRHRLFIMGSKNRKLFYRVFECLAEPGNIAVTEYGEYAVDKPISFAVDLSKLNAQVTHQGLRCR